MSVKPDLGGQTTPIAALESGNRSVAGIFNFGAPVAKKKRLFQFAKRKSASSLGPSRSEFGCD